VVDPLLRVANATHNERPFPMRFLRGRVDTNLEFRFAMPGLTSYVGLNSYGFVTLDNPSLSAAPLPRLLWWRKQRTRGCS
jgi:hypothetical protein